MSGSSPLAHCYAQLLKQSGYDVVRLSVSDLSLPAFELASKLDGSYAVCNFSPVPLLARWTSRSQFDIYSSRMMSLRAYGAAISHCKQKPQIFICISNAMLYDQYEVHDDFSSVFGQTFFTEVGLMETRCTLDIGKVAPNMRLIVARLGFVMCKGSGAFPIMNKLSKIRLGGVVGDGYQCLPMVHVRDAARAIAHLTKSHDSAGIYNVSLPELASMEELVSAFNKKQVSVPLILIKLFAGRASAVLEQNCKVLPSRLSAEGFVFEHQNVREIISSLLAAN